MARARLTPSLRLITITACVLASLSTAGLWWLSAAEPGRTGPEAVQSLNVRAAEAAQALARHQDDLLTAMTAFAPLIADGRGDHGRALLGTLGLRQACVVRPDTGQVVRTYPPGETTCPQRLSLDLRTRLERFAIDGRAVLTPQLRLGRDAPAPLLVTPAYNVLVIGQLAPDRLLAPLRTGDRNLRLRLLDPAGVLVSAGPEAVAMTVRGAVEAPVGQSGWHVRAEAVAPAGVLPSGPQAGLLVLVLGGLAMAVLTAVLAAARMERPLQRAATIARHLGSEGAMPVLPDGKVRPLGGGLGDMEESLAMLADRLARRVEAPLGLPSPGEAGALASRQTGPRTLVVDASLRQGQRLVLELAALGVRADHAGSAARAEEMLEQAAGDGRAFGLVLLDTALPDMPSRALIRRLQSRYGGPPLRIVGMAGPGLEAEVYSELRPALPRPVSVLDLRRLIEGAGGIAHLLVRGQEPDDTPAETDADAPADVLILDDDPECGAVLTREVGAQKMTLRFVTGAECATVLAGLDQPPRLVFIDLALPALNGIETIGQLARRWKSEGPRIAVLVRERSDVIETACRRAGADVVLRKPLDLDALRRVLQREEAEAAPWEAAQISPAPRAAAG